MKCDRERSVLGARSDCCLSRRQPMLRLDHLKFVETGNEYCDTDSQRLVASVAQKVHIEAIVVSGDTGRRGAAQTALLAVTTILLVVQSLPRIIGTFAALEGNMMSNLQAPWHSNDCPLCLIATTVALHMRDMSVMAVPVGPVWS